MPTRGTRQKRRDMYEILDPIQYPEPLHEKEGSSYNEKSTTNKKSITLDEDEVNVVAN